MRIGIIGGGVIARLFTGLTEAVACEPHERVEPLHASHDFRHHLSGPVVAAYVREFVTKHGADAVGWPVWGAGGQNDGRSAEAPCE